MWLFHDEIFMRWTTTQAIMHHFYLLRKRRSLFGLADLSGTKKRKWWRWDCGPKVRQGEGRGWVDWKHWSLSLTSRQSHTTKACVVELSVSPIGCIFLHCIFLLCLHPPIHQAQNLSPTLICGRCKKPHSWHVATCNCLYLGLSGYIQYISSSALVAERDERESFDGWQMQRWNTSAKEAGLTVSLVKLFTANDGDTHSSY